MDKNIKERIRELKLELANLELLCSDYDAQDVDIFYTYLCKELQKHTRQKQQAITILKAKNKKLYKQLKQITELLNDFAFDNDVREKRDIYNLYQIACELICENIVDMGIPLSFKAFLNHIDLFPGLLNKAYPGYLKSGLLKFLLNARNNT